MGLPNRKDIEAEIAKVYPGANVMVLQNRPETTRRTNGYGWGGRKVGKVL